MTPRHHPSEALVAGYAAGTLRPGAALVVRAHLAGCRACRRDAGFFESMGGALMEAEPLAEMSPDALQRALVAIDTPPPPPRRPRVLSPDAAALPAGLGGLTVGRRRWMAPGVWMTPVETDRRSRELVYMLRIGPGMVLPRHTHAGCEFTCVLEGGFSDAGGRYEPGDFVAADESVEHSPVVGRDRACLCLISTDSRLVMRDFIGRMFQPLTGI